MPSLSRRPRRRFELLTNVPHSGAMCVCVCVSFLLLIVVLAVEQPVPAVTGARERAQTHGALDAGLVPGALVHAQQEAVGDGRLAARAQLAPSPVLRTCTREGGHIAEMMRRCCSEAPSQDPLLGGRVGWGRGGASCNSGKHL